MQGTDKMARKAKTNRKTAETEISIEIELDGIGAFDIDTGIPFLTHMLSQFAKHGFFDLKIRAIGDLEVDFHHTVEDVAITLGETFLKALGDKKGIVRYGHTIIPFDDTLVQSAVDLSGRSFFVYNVEVEKGKIGKFDFELGEEFFKSLANTLKCNLHIDLIRGANLHHIIEAIFKATARALDVASSIDPRSDALPSTKGKL